jgi:hypothetical protein
VPPNRADDRKRPDGVIRVRPQPVDHAAGRRRGEHVRTRNLYAILYSVLRRGSIDFVSATKNQPPEPIASMGSAREAFKPSQGSNPDWSNGWGGVMRTRKPAVVFLLEAGCTDAEVSAITGQSRQMVEHYARQVNRKKLAAAAVLKWEAAGDGQNA